MKKLIKWICYYLFFLFVPQNLFAQVVPQGFLIGPNNGIGGQVWSLTNLNTSTFSDGSTIPYYTTETSFAGLTTPASCSVNFNAANDAIYGRLYNWYAINDAKNVCPTNWHVPTSAEFSTLSAFVGVNGNVLKETGTAHWNSGGGTDLYGFKALGAGYMGTTTYSHLNLSTYFWTKTAYNTTNAYAWSLIDNSSTFTSSSQSKIGGFSVRCIHD